jgi:hypothetical protein
MRNMDKIVVPLSSFTPFLNTTIEMGSSSSIGELSSRERELVDRLMNRRKKRRERHKLTMAERFRMDGMVRQMAERTWGSVKEEKKR